MIPKIIHYCWFGGNKLSENERKCIDSWKKYCPDYKIIEWNDFNYDINQNLYIKQAAEAKRWAFVSDYARLDIIYRFGGIYLDTDVEVIKNFDSLLKHSAFAGMENVIGKEYSVNTGLGFGAEKEHPIVKAWRDEYNELSFKKASGQEDLLTTPARTTKYLKSIGFKQENIIQELPGITIYPTEYFCPKKYDTGEIIVTPNTYSIHHYSESWKTNSEKEQQKEWIRLKNKFGEHGANMIVALKNKIRKKGD